MDEARQQRRWHAPRVDVLLRDELLAHLGGRRQLLTALAEGTWVRLLRGVYAPADADADLALRSLAAQRLLPPYALVADRCLLWILGVDVLPPGPPTLEVVVPRGVPLPRRRGVHARITDVPASDAVRVGPHRLRCLRPVRAAADLLRLLPVTEAVVVADAVQHAELASAADLAAELAGHAGLRGVRRARAALLRSDPRAESPPETRLRLRLTAAGLTPVPQHVILDAQGRFVARVDLAFPAARVAVEYDGRAVHEREDVFARDRQRQNALLGLGWVVLRYTAEDLRWRSGFVVDEIAAAVTRRAA